MEERVFVVYLSVKIMDVISMKREGRNDFDGFFREFFNPVCVFIRRIVGREDVVEDLAQDCFVKVYEHWEEFATGENAKAFLYTAAKNRCVDFMKRERAAGRYGEEMAREGEAVEESCLQEIVREETFRLLHAAIDELPAQTKEVVLACMEGLTNEEVGERLGVTVNTVKTLKRGAYAALRRALTREYVVFLFFLLEIFI